MLGGDSRNGVYLAGRSSKGVKSNTEGSEPPYAYLERMPYAYLESIIENSPDAMIVIDQDGLVVVWNKAATKLLGYGKGAVGKRVLDILPEKLRSEGEFGLLRFFMKGKHFALERPMPTMVGMKGVAGTPAEIVVAPVRLDGKLGGIASIRDMTKCRKTEAVLKEREERFRTLIRISPDAITASDLRGRITEVSDRTLQLHGYDNAKELVGKSAFLLIAPQDQEKALSNLRKTLTEGYLANAQYNLLRKDGSTFIGEMNVSRMDGPDGKPIGFMASARDVTKNRKAETRLMAQYVIGGILAQNRPLDHVSTDIIRAVCRYVGWDWGELWTIDQGNGVLRCSKIWHDPSLHFPGFEKATKEMVFRPGIGLPGRAWSREKPVWIKDVTKDPNFLRTHVAVRSSLRGAFAFPIVNNRKVLGVLSFFSREARDPDEELLQTFSVVGDQIGQFIGRMRAQEALRDSEERFRKIFEEGPLGVTMVGLDFRFLSVNPTLCRMWGYSEKELRGLTFMDITHPDDAKRDLENVRRLKRGEIPKYKTNKRYIRKDGKTIWAELNSTMVRNAEGKPLYFLTTVEDITDHVEMEDALRQSEETHRIIVENSHDCVMVTRPDGVISYLSPACKNVLGYLPEELIGQRPIVIHPDDHAKVDRIFSRALEGESGTNVEYRVLTKDGDAKWVSHSWSPIISEGKPRMVVSIIRDISERKKMESFRKEYYLMVEKEIVAKNKELKERQEELERKDRLLDEVKKIVLKKENELVSLRREIKRLRMIG
jgi:PAS domain S-box-containing protein